MASAQTIEPVLQDHPFTRGLPPEHIESLSACSSTYVIGQGDYLWRQGDPAETFYLLFAGEVSLGMTTPNEGLLRLETLGPGDVLGWSWIVPPYRWHFDAYALSIAEAIGINAEHLRERCKVDPQLHLQLLMRLVPVIDRRLHATRRKLLDLSTK